jgi:CheY-like chemotaxis protein
MSRRILVVCDDLLFWARIRAGAQSAGTTAVRISDAASLEAALAEGGIVRVLADLGSKSVDPLSLARRLRGLPEPPVLVAFGSHVDDDLLEQARLAGYDEVLPNSALHRRVEELTR